MLGVRDEKRTTLVPRKTRWSSQLPGTFLKSQQVIGVVSAILCSRKKETQNNMKNVKGVRSHVLEEPKETSFLKMSSNQEATGHRKGRILSNRPSPSLNMPKVKGIKSLTHNPAFKFR